MVEKNEQHPWSESSWITTSIWITPAEPQLDSGAGSSWIPLTYTRTFMARGGETHTGRSTSKPLFSHAAPVAPASAGTCEKVQAQHRSGQSILLKPFVSQRSAALCLSSESRVISIPVKEAAFLCFNDVYKNSNSQTNGEVNLGFYCQQYCAVSLTARVMRFDIDVCWRIVFKAASEGYWLYEPAMELKTALLRLPVIHQPRFTLTLLLCKCLYHISCGIRVREWHPSQMRQAPAQRTAGSQPLTNTLINALITSAYCLSVQPINLWCQTSVLIILIRQWGQHNFLLCLQSNKSILLIQ